MVQFQPPVIMKEFRILNLSIDEHHGCNQSKHRRCNNSISIQKNWQGIYYESRKNLNVPCFADRTTLKYLLLENKTQYLQPHAVPVSHYSYNCFIRFNQKHCSSHQNQPLNIIQVTVQSCLLTNSYKQLLKF